MGGKVMENLMSASWTKSPVTVLDPARPMLRLSFRRRGIDLHCTYLKTELYLCMSSSHENCSGCLQQYHMRLGRTTIARRPLFDAENTVSVC